MNLNSFKSWLLNRNDTKNFQLTVLIKIMTFISRKINKALAAM